MAGRPKTVADAIELFSELSGRLDGHLVEYKTDRKEVMDRIVVLEKGRIEDAGDLKLVLQTVNTINKRLDNGSESWKIWVPVILSALIGVSGVIVAIIAIFVR